VFPIGIVGNFLYNGARVVRQGHDVVVGLLAVEVAVGPGAGIVGAVPVVVFIFVKDQWLVDLDAAVYVLAAGFPGVVFLAFAVLVPFAFFDNLPAIIKIQYLVVVVNTFFCTTIEVGAAA